MCIRDRGITMQTAIKVEQLSKSYGNLLAIDQISLSVKDKKKHKQIVSPKHVPVLLHIHDFPEKPISVWWELWNPHSDSCLLYTSLIL